MNTKWNHGNNGSLEVEGETKSLAVCNKEKPYSDLTKKEYRKKKRDKVIKLRQKKVRNEVELKIISKTSRVYADFPLSRFFTQSKIGEKSLK